MYNDPIRPNATYGFTDTVAKSGNLLFCSLLYIDASRQLAELAEQYGCGDAARYNREATAAAAAIDPALKDPSSPWWLAATIDNRVPDVWGTAYLVALNLSSAAKRRAAMEAMVSKPDDFFSAGQVRSMPAGKYWSRCCWQPPMAGGACQVSNGSVPGPGCPAAGTYQNGAFWATPLAYFAAALTSTGFGPFAELLVSAAVTDFKQNGIYEDVDYGRPATSRGVLNYTASVVNVLAAARLLTRRDITQSGKLL